MKRAELPAFLRRHVVIVDGHWIDPRFGDPSKKPYVYVMGQRFSSRQAAWRWAGMEENPAQRLRPICGEPKCVRPDHCRYTVKAPCEGVELVHVDAAEAAKLEQDLVAQGFQKQATGRLEWPRVNHYTIRELRTRHGGRGVFAVRWKESSRQTVGAKQA